MVPNAGRGLMLREPESKGSITVKFWVKLDHGDALKEVSSRFLMDPRLCVDGTQTEKPRVS